MKKILMITAIVFCLLMLVGCEYSTMPIDEYGNANIWVSDVQIVIIVDDGVVYGPSASIRVYNDNICSATAQIRRAGGNIIFSSCIRAGSSGCGSANLSHGDEIVLTIIKSDGSEITRYLIV